MLKKAIVLDNNGIPNGYGFSSKPLSPADLNNARPALRYKEWDFYQITKGNYVLQATFGHISYAGTVCATLFSLDGEIRKEVIIPLVLPLRSLNMPTSAKSNCRLVENSRTTSAVFVVEDGLRTINIVGKTTDKEHCKINLKLSYPITDDGILVCTPFQKKNQFYYNYKQCCMRVSGSVNMGDISLNFDGKNDFALIDWGRGVLPYTHSWWWGNGSTILPEGKRFGFNVGVFGNNEHATENALFYDGKLIKLDDVSYVRGNTYDKEVWRFKSSDGKFDMTMTPIYDNATETNLIIAHNRCHQVFGKWNGTVVIEDGKTIKINDMIAFVEEAKNRW